MRKILYPLLILSILLTWGHVLGGDAYAAARQFMEQDPMARSVIGKRVYVVMMLYGKGSTKPERQKEDASFQLAIFADQGFSLVHIELAKQNTPWLATSCQTVTGKNCISEHAAAIAAERFPRPARTTAEYQVQKAEYEKKLAGYQSYQKALALKNQGQRDEAIEEFKRSIEADPKLFNSYYYLDELLAANQQWDEIIGYWSRYIAVVPDNARAYMERGGARHRKGDEQAALDDARQACRLGDQYGCNVVKKYQ